MFIDKIIHILYFFSKFMEEQIEFNYVSKLLLKKFPDFIEGDLWYDGDEILEYQIASNFARYILKNADENNMEQMKKCFEFIELLLINGTEKTKELAVIGYLEDLQNFTGGNKIMEKYEFIYDFLGIESKKWWNTLNDLWSGK